MPIPAAVLNVIGAGLTSGGNIVSNLLGNLAARREASHAYNVNNINAMRMMGYNQGLWKQQNQYNQEVWQQQNDYNMKVWEIMNKYNSPIEQMARFKEAGLNPRLIYGQGSSGNAGMIPTSSIDVNAQKSPDAVNYNPAQVGSVMRGFNAMGDYIHLREVNARVDNIEAQTDVARQEALVKAQDRMLKSLSYRRGSLQYGIDKRLVETSVSAAEENLRLLQQNVKKASAEAYVSQNTSDERIQQAQIDVNNALMQLRGQSLLNELRRIELNLNKHGVQKADNIIFRALLQPENYKWIDKIKDLF